MSDADATIQATAQLIHEVSQAKTMAIVLIIVIAVLALCGFGLWLYFRNKSQKLEREAQTAADTAKFERAKMYQDSFEGLRKGIIAQSATFQQHVLRDEETNARLYSTLTGLSSTMSNMHGAMGGVERMARQMLLKQDGALSKQNAISMLEQVFCGVIAERIVGVLSHSLIENDYVRRREFISEKMKTDIGMILVEARDNVRRIPMDLLPDNFFILEDTDRGERFVLCDCVWREIEPLYRSEANITQRLDEMRYKVGNVVKDYFTHHRAIAEDTTGAQKAVRKSGVIKMPRGKDE